MALRSFIESKCINFENNVYFFNTYNETEFSKIYISLREKEQRVYNNTVVKNLPNFNEKNPLLEHEWTLRKISSIKLKEYFFASFPNAQILEVGCGNGWLCNFLSSKTNSIFGLDVNLMELQQAGELFYKKNKVQFLFGDLFHIDFPKNSFDIIIFASSIQYFSNIPDLLKVCRDLLTEKGEIHILDSHIYRPDEVELAKMRSIDYYKKIGFPEMNNYYFHHSDKELSSFNPIVIYNPNSYIQKVKNIISKTNFVPFPWIKILKS